MPRSTNKKTPYSFVFGAEAVVSAEMQGQSLRICHFDPVIHDEPLCTDLSFIEELRVVARTRVERYKKPVQAAFNSRVQEFPVRRSGVMTS